MAHISSFYFSNFISIKAIADLFSHFSFHLNHVLANSETALYLTNT